jgi:4-hydroxy-3-methylbut-2-en-1-yl diphosphate reductase
MCFGVRDAIDLAKRQATQGPTTILGELVHNEHVLAALRQRGIRMEKEASQVATATAIITAHGASELAKRRAESFGLHILEATCPLVQLVHHSAARLARDGWHPVIVGKRDHTEVRGIVEDLAEYDVVSCADDVLSMKPRSKFGVVAQTTQPIDRVKSLVDLIGKRFPQAEVKFIDTVCQPTKQRQSAAIEISQLADAVVVVGGARSNNTRELAATCARYCPCVIQIQSAEDLRPEWFEGVQVAGLTAGTSTPDDVIDAVETRLTRIAERKMAAVPVEA